MRNREWAINVIPASARVTGLSGEALARSDLVAFADQLESCLQELGLTAGDRVVTLFPQGEKSFLSMLACAELAVAVPIAPDALPAEVCDHLEKTQPRVALIDADLAEGYQPLCLQRGIGVITVGNQWHLDVTQPDRLTNTGLAGKGNGHLNGVLLTTSGTSGEPKLVMLGMDQLWTVAGRIAKSLQLQNGERYLCVMPCHLIHGLSTALAALSSGGTVLFSRAFRPAEVLRQLSDGRINWISAAPTHYRALLGQLEKSPDAPDLSHLRLLRSASAPMDKALVERLTSGFAVTVIQAYGMTEAGPLIASNGLEPGGNKHGSVGRPIGVKVLVGAPGDEAEAGCSGNIWIRGDTVATDYWTLESSRRTAPSAEQAWLRTGDIGHFDQEGFLFVSGRERDLINAGGEKILPATIEAVLLKHPAVRVAVVYPAPHDSLGEAPHAAVILADRGAGDGSPPDSRRSLADGIRQHCVARLRRSQVPHKVNVCGQIPEDAQGKVQRQDLYAHFSRPAGGADQIAAKPNGQDPIQEAIVRCWRRILPIQTVNSDENFFSLGGDSLSAADLTLELEDLFKLGLEEEFVFLWPTPEQQASEVSARKSRLEGNGGDLSSDFSQKRIRLQLGELVPLSPGQQRLWFLDQLGSGAGYTMCSPVLIDGELDRGLLEAALGKVVARHCALRTRISMLDGRAVQYIEPILVPKLQFHDLRACNSCEVEKAALNQVREEQSFVFDLSGAVPVRYTLLQLEDQKYAFVLTIHHIICDGWSVPVFFRDLLACYEDPRGNAPIMLPAPAADAFADFCYDQQALAGMPGYQEKLNWWRENLEESVQQLPVFKALPRPGTASGQAAQKHFTVSPHDTQALREAARAKGLSLFPLLMSALQVAVFAHSGRTRFCIGTVAANRRKREQENAVGFFANTLAIPACVLPDSGLMTLIDSAAAAYRGAVAHAEVDLSRIAGLFKLDRNRQSNTLVEVMFAYQNYPSLAARLDGLETKVALRSFRAEPQRSRFALSLYITPSQEQLDGRWQYRSSLFSAEDIERIDQVFQAALKEIAAQGRARITDLVGNDVPARSANEVSVAASTTPMVVSRVAAHAQSKPDAVAIRSQESELTYIELNREVGRLESLLGSAGAMPGSKIAVLLSRGIQSVVAPLAIWSRQATYIPLDDELPLERLCFMIDSAEITGLLCSNETRALAERLRERTNVARLIDYKQSSAGTHPLPFFANDQEAAYVIFTSGSTGTPKGVEISFANLDFYLETLSGALGISDEDIYLLSASVSFSSSIRQIALPLYSGAGIFVATHEDIRNPLRLPQLVQEAALTVVDLVPSHWRNIVRAHQGLTERGKHFHEPRLLLSASEALPAEVAGGLCSIYPNSKLVNMYGQTETTGICLINNDAGNNFAGPYVPLGYPLASIQFDIVDGHGSTVPEGTQGELIITGPTVGLGYLPGVPNSEDRFFIHEGQRAYRSGDQVYSDNTGQIHFAGRLDTQIKHRGFRIEPGDIESVARGFPAIRDAVVLLRNSGDQEERLQLYFSLEPEVDPDSDFTDGLKDYLSGHLPGYMLPSVYKRLDVMPRTPSGKIDRSAIIEAGPAAASRSLNSAVEGGMASRLRSIWERVLLNESIGPDDNFFDLGGNSLLSLEVVHCAHDAGIALSLEQLFQYQTINALASVVQAKSGDSPPVAVGGSGISRSQRSSDSLAEDELPRFEVESLRNFSDELLRDAGLAEEGLRILTDVQLESSLRGQVTHNIGDIPRYAKRLKQGVLNGQPDISVTDVTAFSASVDGDNAPGQWVATVAMDKAITLAQSQGVGIVGVRRSNHYGAAGQYAWQASQAGLIGLCFTNGPVILAPTGGNEPLFGNNPLAVGIPRPGQFPVILDMAMSVATRGKIGLTVAEGKPLDAGWILDSLGMPSTSLEDLAAGLAEPIGGHKGYGLAFVIEILAGALTGSGYCADHSGKIAARHGGSDIGHLFITLKPELLMSKQVFTRRVEDIIGQTKTSRKIDGVEEIFIPGEQEMRAREHNLGAGIPMHASSLKRLLDYASRFDISSKIVKVGQ